MNDAGRAAEAEPLLVRALDAMQSLGEVHPRRAEAACELARARLARTSTPAEWDRLSECLPRYRAWGLADPDALKAFTQLLAPAPRKP